jgi:hypothetical protein
MSEAEQEAQGKIEAGRKNLGRNVTSSGGNEQDVSDQERQAAQDKIDAGRALLRGGRGPDSDLGPDTPAEAQATTETAESQEGDS